MNHILIAEYQSLGMMTQDLQNRVLSFGNLLAQSQAEFNHELAQQFQAAHDAVVAAPLFYVPTALNGGLPANPEFDQPIEPALAPALDENGVVIDSAVVNPE